MKDIGSAKVASQETTTLLLTLLNRSNPVQEKKNIKESIADKKRFEKNDKQKVSTFANESIKYVVKNGKGKLNKVRVVKGLFGSIL